MSNFNSFITKGDSGVHTLIFNSSVVSFSYLTFGPLVASVLLDTDGELASVGVEASHTVVGHGGGPRCGEVQLVVARHAVERLRQVRRSLQNDLLRKFKPISQATPFFLNNNLCK